NATQARKCSAPCAFTRSYLKPVLLGFSFGRLGSDPGNWNSPSRRKALPELASNAQAVSVTGCAGNWSVENHTCHVSHWSRLRFQQQHLHLAHAVNRQSENERLQRQENSCEPHRHPVKPDRLSPGLTPARQVLIDNPKKENQGHEQEGRESYVTRVLRLRYT